MRAWKDADGGAEVPCIGERSIFKRQTSAKKPVTHPFPSQTAVLKL